jgi:ribosomal protein S13
MNLDQIEHSLAEIANSGDETFANFASQIAGIVEQAKAGKMSNEEVAEIMRDAQSQLAILEEMSAMQFKEKLNTLINGIIFIATAV